MPTKLRCWKISTLLFPGKKKKFSNLRLGKSLSRLYHLVRAIYQHSCCVLLRFLMSCQILWPRQRVLPPQQHMTSQNMFPYLGSQQQAVIKSRYLCTKQIREECCKVNRNGPQQSSLLFSEENTLFVVLGMFASAKRKVTSESQALQTSVECHGSTALFLFFFFFFFFSPSFLHTVNGLQLTFDTPQIKCHIYL